MKKFLLVLVVLLAGCKVCPDGSVWGPSGTCDEDQGGECCKVCDGGQACGDTCIAWEDECSQPSGCACQAVEASE